LNSIGYALAENISAGKQSRPFIAWILRSKMNRLPPITFGHVTWPSSVGEPVAGRFCRFGLDGDTQVERWSDLAFKPICFAQEARIFSLPTSLFPALLNVIQYNKANSLPPPRRRMVSGVNARIV